MTDSDHPTPLDVLILAEDFYPKESGGAFIDWNVATHLAAEGDSVTVVTPRNRETAPTEFVDRVEIRRPFRGPPINIHPNSLRGICRRLLFVFFIIPYLFYLCWQREFDIVYSTNHLLHFPAALLSTVFCISHISFVGYSPSIQDEVSLMNPLIILERLNFRFFMGDRALCRTPSTYDVLSSLSTAEVNRIDGIVDEDTVSEAVRPTEEPEIAFGSTSGIRLIFVGRLVDIKNPTEMPALVSRLPPEYSLLIVGDGPRRTAVEEAIRKFNVDDRVHLTGRLPHKQTLKAIHKSDILLLPSKVEAYPSVVFEALSLNTPVLATPVGVLTTIEHSNLVTSDLSDFGEVIKEMSGETKRGIDQKALQRFSVNKFSSKVRENMLKITSNDS